MKSHGLSIRQLESLKRSLAAVSHSIDRVALFGSRATGRWRPSSDIDVVLFGTLSPRDVSSIRASLDDSDLPFKVDVLAYAEINDAALKAHINRVALFLFTKEDLVEAEARGVGGPVASATFT